MKCRHCGSSTFWPFLDLGTAPPSNSYVSLERLDQPESWYPLKIATCRQCLLVQTEDFADREMFFSDSYAYFSSFSTSWLQHAETYVGQMIDRFGFKPGDRIVEVAANDGYLLQFANKAGLECLGIEPTASTAAAARAKGLTVIEDFFGVELARALASDGVGADLMVANNVLAHVPDINDFVRGFSILLKPEGVATFEFPHVINMVAENQFDTAYHEHYSYLSLTAVKTIFEANGLVVFDVETTPWHGGSLRVFAARAASRTHKPSPKVEAMLAAERQAGLFDEAWHRGFQHKAQAARNGFVRYLMDCQDQGLKVAAYGAAAKGNTLINFAGIKPDLISFVVDKNPAKQGLYLPGSRIPILGEAALRDFKPERVVILPWNIRDEIMKQLSYIADWDGRFVTAIPQLTVWPIP